MSDTSMGTLDQETPELSPEEQRKAQLAAKAPVLTGSGAILKSLELLGIKRLRLMTNNPQKVAGLQAAGIDVVERLPIMAGRNPHNDAYLATKAAKFGHELDDPNP